MGNRTHNIFFNLHTVSGIVISVALYVIFFCGAFALFKDEIGAWESGIPINKKSVTQIDYDSIVYLLESKDYELYGRDIRMVVPEVNQRMLVSLTASKDSLASDDAKMTDYFYLDLETFQTSNYFEIYDLGEFIYRLHFFSQLPTIGIYLAGFVALFFLFAISTGVIVHWKKIIKNFYVFRPKAKLKTVWTDAHTVLGMIGLPFQFVFAVTSCFLCMSILVLIPANFLYDGDQEKLLEDLRPISKTYPLTDRITEKIEVQPLIDKGLAEWKKFTLAILYFKNYGAENMKIQVDGLLHPKEKFLGNGRIVYDLRTQKIETIKNPYENDYIEGVELTVRRLHFGDYGGVTLKFIYALLAFVTCFVIITGVLIWLEARNKKNIPAAEQLYNRKVGHIYLAICLTLFPVIAFCFILARLLPADMLKMNVYYLVFFLLWIVLSAFFRFKRDNFFTNKYTLLSGSALGFLIPIVNGVTSGNWIWKTYADKAYEIFVVDFFWLLLAAISLFITLKLKRKHPNKNHENLLSAAFNEVKSDQLKEPRPNSKINTNYIPMRTKISILWLFIALGWIVHHLYGLFNIYYNETLIMDGATGEAPIVHHVYRMLFEGIALCFALLTLEISKPWFRWTTFVWAIIGALYNIYHFVTALMYEPSNISEIFVLALMVVASLFLYKNLNLWTKDASKGTT